MGLFSWDCHCCGQSMRRARGKKDPEAWRGDVVVIAQTGETHAGAYDGYGHVGGWTIPETWGDDGARQWLFEAEHDEARARKIREAVLAFETLPSHEGASREALNMLRSTLKHYEESAASARSHAARHAKTDVLFTVYHRRCHESAGSPGFQGQSKRSEDQGG